MYEVMMMTILSFTDKLLAMENRISGIAFRFDDPATSQKTTVRKSHSHSKRRQAKTMRECCSFQRPFSDTAVMIKAMDTPARLKKQKKGNDLVWHPILMIIQ